MREKFQITIDSTKLDLIKEAARMNGTTPTEIIRLGAQEKAMKIIATHKGFEANTGIAS